MIQMIIVWEKWTASEVRHVIVEAELISKNLLIIFHVHLEGRVFSIIRLVVVGISPLSLILRVFGGIDLLLPIDLFSLRIIFLDGRHFTKLIHFLFEEGACLLVSLKNLLGS